MKFTINNWLRKNWKIYGIPNDRIYTNDDLLHYQQKFILKYISDLDQSNQKKAIENLIVVSCWFSAIISRFHIDLQSQVKKRYSYKCPFCLSMPCNCQNLKQDKAKKTGRPTSQTPATIQDWQKMVGKIYPDENLTKVNQILLYESDKLGYAFRQYIQNKGKSHFKELEVKCADFFVLLLRLFNSLDKDLSSIYLKMFRKGCYVCRQTPCRCNYYE